MLALLVLLSLLVLLPLLALLPLLVLFVLTQPFGRFSERLLSLFECARGLPFFLLGLGDLHQALRYSGSLARHLCRSLLGSGILRALSLSRFGNLCGDLGLLCHGLIGSIILIECSGFARSFGSLLKGLRTAAGSGRFAFSRTLPASHFTSDLIEVALKLLLLEVGFLTNFLSICLGLCFEFLGEFFQLILVGFACCGLLESLLGLA